MEQVVGNFLYNTLNARTGTWDTYRKAPNWLDGSPMTAAKANGVDFRQFAAQPDNFWQLIQPDDICDLARYGLVPDGVTDNYQVLQDLLNYYPKGDARTLRLPSGRFFCSQMLVIQDRTYDLAGSGGTVLVFPRGVSGILVTRTTGIQGLKMRRLRIQAVNVDVTDGNNQLSTNPQDYYVAGLTVEAVSYLEDLEIDSFSHNLIFQGDVLYKDIAHPVGSDSSSSCVKSCRFTNAGWNNVWIPDHDTTRARARSNTDANVINFYNCVARDARGVGFHDQSFLGNFFFGCQGDSNAMGHYRVDGSTAQGSRASFVGCYGESGNGRTAEGVRDGSNVASHLEGYADWHGGNHSNGWTYSTNWNGWAQEGKYVRQIFVGGFALNADRGQSWINPAGDSSIYTNAISGGGGIKVQQYMSFDVERLMHEMFEGGVPVNVQGTTETRRALAAGHNYPAGLMVNGRYTNFPIQALADLQNMVGDIRAGDRFVRDVRRTGYDRSTVNTWECISPGAYDVTYTEGLTASNQNGQLVLSGPSTQIKVGHAITAAGLTVVVTNIYFDPNTGYVVQALTTAPSALTSPNVTYARPVFAAVGRGIGPLAKRPALTINDAGYEYLATDGTPGLALWTGTSWLSL